MRNMANYSVTFETMDDTSARGGKRGPASRHFDVDAKSPKQAIEAAYPKLIERVAAGYCKVNDTLGIKGEVRRDRTSPNMWYTGRRHDESNDPRWNFVFTVLTGPQRWDIKLEKVQ